jgi:GMP synthase-like glutamine amidotransferase
MRQDALVRILCIRHPGGGHAGVMGPRATAAGHVIDDWTAATEAAPPSPAESYDCLFVLGGGMNVPEAGRKPYLRTEIGVLEDALARSQPVLGICLGSQLLATAAGASVHRARTPEIGWREVELCSAAAADRVVGALPRRFTAFQWHSYAFEIPFGAVELARNEVCPQAYRLGDAAWGVQFHPEVTEEILDEWFSTYDVDPDAVAMGFDPDAATAELPARLPRWNELGGLLFDAFLAAAAARGARAA